MAFTVGGGFESLGTGFLGGAARRSNIPATSLTCGQMFTFALCLRLPLLLRLRLRSRLRSRLRLRLSIVYVCVYV